MQLGYIGLGKMGTRMVEKLIKGGHVVVGWNRSKDIVDQFRLVLTEQKLEDKFVAADAIETLVKGLTPPRVIWSMLPAGEATENVIGELLQYVEEGDIVIDGGNAHFRDTQRRSEVLSAKGIEFLGIGVSGGVLAAENGYPLMAGGSKKGYEYVVPLLDCLARPNGGHEYFGSGGAGHFIKMVHNGIEYGIMQSLGEGFGVLEKAPYPFDLVKVGKLWQKGTLVTGFMLDRTVDGLSKNHLLDDIEGIIDATGEAAWTVEEGKKEEVPVDVIEKSLEFRSRSKTQKEVSESFAARVVAMQRKEFGGHAVKKKK